MSGYSNYSKSNNAIDAEAHGLMTATALGRALHVPAAAVRAVLTATEWHHTSCKYNCTDYFDGELYLALADPAADCTQLIDNYGEDYVTDAAEDLLDMRTHAKIRRTAAVVTHENCMIRWVEWFGQGRHKCRCDYAAGRVTITDKGGPMAECTWTADGLPHRLLKKKASKWFEARDTDGRRLFDGGSAID